MESPEALLRRKARGAVEAPAKAVGEEAGPAEAAEDRGESPEALREKEAEEARDMGVVVRVVVETEAEASLMAAAAAPVGPPKAPASSWPTEFCSSST